MNREPDSAITLLDRAIDLDRKNYVAYSNKAVIYCARKDFENAIKAIQQGLNIKPDLAEGVVMLGMLYDYTRKPGLAKAQYEKAIKLYDDRLALSDVNRKANRLNRAHALLLLGKEEEGQREVGLLLSENPTDAGIQMLVDFNKEKYLNDVLGLDKK